MTGTHRRWSGGTWWSGRAPLWLGLTAIVAASWLVLLHMYANMPAMNGGASAGSAMVMPATGAPPLAASFAMWVVMMLAMMLPSVAPALPIYLGMAGQRDPDRARAMSALYATGYVAPWIVYAAPAALAQWVLTRQMLLDPMGESASAWLSAAILMIAGLYQFLPLKHACLRRCRSPLAFFLMEWRDGRVGAFTLGIRHGAFCVGCCWALMAVMFVVGTMNLAWMAVVALAVLGEKLVPARWRFDSVVGVVLIVWGAATVVLSG